MSKRDLLRFIKKYKQLKASIKQLEKEQEEIKKVLTAEMSARNETELPVDIFTIHWKEVETPRINSAELRKEFPEIAERFTTITISRPLKIL